MNSQLLPLRRRDKIKILHEILGGLDDLQKIAIYFRFWENFTVSQIAELTNTSWDEIDKLIEKTLSELKEKIMDADVPFIQNAA